MSKSFSAMESFLKSLPGAATTIVIPHYSDDDPEVFVLFKSRQVAGDSILYVTKRLSASGDQSEWSVIGHIDRETNSADYDAISKKILSVRLATIRR